MSVVLGTAPMTVSIFVPSLKIITVGMLRMPYSAATPGLSSVLSLNCTVDERCQSSILRRALYDMRHGHAAPLSRQCLNFHYLISRRYHRQDHALQLSS